MTQAEPSGADQETPPGPRDRARWPVWSKWSLGALAFVANLVGVIGAATTSPAMLARVAAALAAVVGGIGLWRLAGRARTLIFALCLSSVTVSSGVIGYLFVDKPASPPPAVTHPSGPSLTGAVPTATFLRPVDGHTLFSGDDVYGTVENWAAGYQLWLFVRADGGARGEPQGPCGVAGTTWTCARVTLAGRSGTRNTLDLMIAPDPAAGPSAPAVPCDQRQVYKG